MKKSQKKKAKSPLYAGIDLGGTNVVAILADRAGKIVAHTRFETQASGGPAHVIGRIADNVLKLAEKTGVKASQVAGMGIGAPGPLDSAKGIVLTAPNMPGWKNIKLKAELEKLTKIKTGVENDANCAVYGEKWAGAAKGYANVVGFTLGTGVGGGIIINDRLLRGASNTAGEIGHTIVEINGKPCGCGGSGHLEVYASATGIANMAKEKIKQGRRSAITQIVKGDLGKITSKTVYEAMLSGDKTAAETWADFIKYLAAGIADSLNVINPEIVVIAGGVINAGERLFKPLRVEVSKLAFDAPFRAAKIVPARLGEEAGAIGAAGVVINEGSYYGV